MPWSNLVMCWLCEARTKNETTNLVALSTMQHQVNKRSNVNKIPTKCPQNTHVYVALCVYCKKACKNVRTSNRRFIHLMCSLLVGNFIKKVHSTHTNGDKISIHLNQVIKSVTCSQFYIFLTIFSLWKPHNVFSQWGLLILRHIHSAIQWQWLGMQNIIK